MIETIMIQEGCGKSGEPEPVREIELKKGNKVTYLRIDTQYAIEDEK